MPRAMPPLAGQFGQQVDKALSIAQVGEIIRISSPRTSIAWRELYAARLEVLYELAYLRIFIWWESFLEESFLRYLCGYISSAGPASLANQPCKTIDDARRAILGGQDYVSWSFPTSIERRCRRFVKNGLHELVISSNRARLEWFASVRNRIAHGSTHSKNQFNMATMGLVGRRYRGASPGRFLRDWVVGVSPSERWIQTIATELKNLALQIVP
jgi:hypothetical protein